MRRVDPDGIITTVAGDGMPGSTGDGNPATLAQLDPPVGVSVGPDEAIFVAETGRIRRFTLGGLIGTVAGTGPACGPFVDDGASAVLATLPAINEVTAGPDGGVYALHGYIECEGGVRRIGLDGILTTVVGGGGYFGDGGPARTAGVGEPQGLAIAPDGTLYIADFTRVRRVTTDGRIATYAGSGSGVYSGDGGPATDAGLSAGSVEVGADGILYLTDGGNFRVRAVTPDGIITTVAGNGTQGTAGDGGPATQAQFDFLSALAIGPDGSLYVADGARVRRIRRTMPGLSLADTLIASEDGREVYRFDSAGRHQETLDALTGGRRWAFVYDAATGLLTEIRDGNPTPNVTRIERDGNDMVIIASGGQRTELTLGADGFLTSVKTPALEETTFTHASGGLLATKRDPRLHDSTYEYDDLGGLERDEDAAGGFHALVRTPTAEGFTVSRATGEGRTSTFLVEQGTDGGRRRRNTFPSGVETDLQVGIDGARTTTFPDGQVTTVVPGADPRFGMQAPRSTSLTISTPSGLLSTLTESRAVTLADPGDPLSLTSATTTFILNGQTYTRTFTAGPRTLTDMTPLGRQRVTTLDSLGRVVSEELGPLAPTTVIYDTQGRVATITRGTGPAARSYTLGYDPQHRLTSITDPLARVLGFVYDAADRVIRQTLPDLREVAYTYDANGNVTSITPPSRPAHAFTYTPVDLEATYAPPPVAGSGTTNTVYTYNLDRQLTRITRPDGATVDPGYDSAGRLQTLTTPDRVVTYGYHATTGVLTSLGLTPGADALSYAYDGPLLTTTTWSGAVAGSVGRTYDNNLRVTATSVNGGQTATFQYDNDGLLTQASGPAPAGALTFTREPQTGLVTGTTLGVVSDTRTYNTFGELSSMRTTLSGVERLKIEYTQRDTLGRITEKRETVSGVTTTVGYGYDLAGRLAIVTTDGVETASYTYDANGNRLTAPGLTAPPVYDDQDRLLVYGAATYTYTANGELATKTVSGQTTSYTYDVPGNLRTVDLPGGTVIEYIEDARNRRIGKKVNGVLVQGLVWENPLRPTAELDPSGAVVARFVYGTRTNVPEYVVKGGSVYRLVADHLGSPRLVVNVATGAVAQELAYDEFGRVFLDTNPGFQPFGFGGGLYDGETKLVRLGARDYQGDVGRWAAKDPIRFLGGDTNLYRYVVADPVNRTDVLGLIAPVGAAIAACLADPPCAGAVLLGLAATGAVVGDFLSDRIRDRDNCPRETVGTPDQPLPDLGDPGDPGQSVQLCIALCRARFRGMPLKQALCIAGCIVAAF